jgi:hypothetical protein
MTAREPLRLDLDDLAVDTRARSSGTRRAARAEPMTVNIPKLPPGRVPGQSIRPSQRPTIPAPAAVDLLAFLAEKGATLATALEDVPFVRRMPKTGEIDHVAGFLLSRVDGMSTFEQILDVCGMPAERATRVLEDLWRQGVIGFR